MFALGQRLKDKVSGLVGIATSRTQFLNGCVRYSIQPPIDKDGKLPQESSPPTEPFGIRVKNFKESVDGKEKN